MRILQLCGTPSSLSFDGRFLAGGDENRVVIWDVGTIRPVRVLECPSKVESVAFTPDMNKVAATAFYRGVCVFDLDWDYEIPEEARWDEGARPYIESFLTLQTPYAGPFPAEGNVSFAAGERRLERKGTPSYNDEDFDGLLLVLRRAGYGLIPPEMVRTEVEKSAARRLADLSTAGRPGEGRAPSPPEEKASSGAPEQKQSWLGTLFRKFRK